MNMQSAVPLTIRLSTMKDARELMMLDQLVWNERNTPSVLCCSSRRQYLQSSPPGSQLLAIRYDQVCGYVGFRHPHPLEISYHVYDIHIAVHPQHQGQNIGTQLMDALCTHARTHHIRKLTLRVLSTNTEAVHFYDKYGFVENGRLREQFYINGQYVDDIFMTYWL